MALFCAGLYTKQTIVFMAPVFAAVLWWERGRRIWTIARMVGDSSPLRDCAASACGGDGRFGRTNMESVAGGRWAQGLTIASFTYYPSILLRQLGWGILVLASLGIALAALDGFRSFPRPMLLLNSGWAAVGYVFFSLIALKEPRHTLVILFPLCLAAAMCFRRLPGNVGSSRWLWLCQRACSRTPC